MGTKIWQGYTKPEMQLARQLFIEYQSFLGFDLDFQGFQEELENLPGDYAPPQGCIILASIEEEIAGCVALHKWENDICEMKRLFVRSCYRKRGLGKMLAEEVVAEARKIGYTSMRLDTIDWMHGAIALYLALGFAETQPYRFNPVNGARFFEKKL